MAFQWTAGAVHALYLRSDFSVSETLNGISKRSATADGSSGTNPGNAANIAVMVLGLVNIVVWVPVFLFLGYTLNSLIPALAAVEEDDAPPAYQPVSLKDDNDVKKGLTSNVEAGSHVSQRGPVTAGIWATCRLLCSFGGYPSFFRGLGTAAFYNFARFCVNFLILLAWRVVLPMELASFTYILANLATVQLSTLWLHTVISTSSGSKTYWQRLPAFRTAFRATALPTLAADMSVVLINFVGKAMYASMGIKNGNPFDGPTAGSNPTWRLLSVPFVQILLLLVIAIPTHVVLVRCQASMLPEDENTIVPFDRTFQLESVRAKGYASMTEAFKSFSPAAWKRIVMLHVKTVFITIATEVAVAGLIFVQLVLFSSLFSKSRN